MKRSRRLVAVMALAAAAAGSSGCRKTVLKGRIELQGADVGQVAVRIIPEKDVKAYFDAKAPTAIAELDQRQRAFEAASRQEDAATRELQGAYSAAKGGAISRDGVSVTRFGNGGAIATYDKNAHTEAEARTIARGALEDAAKTQAGAAERFSAEKPMLEDARRAGRETKEGAGERVVAWETDMLADLPAKGDVVYTDGHGAFTARLPRGQKVAVVATVDLKSRDTVQRRAWGLWVKLDAAEKAIDLDSSNLLLETPRDSVLR